MVPAQPPPNKDQGGSCYIAAKVSTREFHFSQP
jgi:hypothetical protein